MMTERSGVPPDPSDIDLATILNLFDQIFMGRVSIEYNFDHFDQKGPVSILCIVQVFHF